MFTVYNWIIDVKRIKDNNEGLLIYNILHSEPRVPERRVAQNPE